MSAILALFVSLLIGQGFSQCFTNTDCTGGLVEAADQRACCVGTDDGLSFNDGTTCTLCIVHGFRQSKYDVEENERLGTRFQLNVKGTTQFGGALVVTGLITAAADGTASTSDFERLAPIRVTNAEIRLFAANDDITLEYDDRVLLRFTPDIPDLIPGLEANGEYIRDTATVNIIDKDCKCSAMSKCLPFTHL
ncbi:hypothetical protein GBAR_LOCUS7955 [Geodia barretti]|uniref:Uncharacterized protein n=1 Tax=Geodia barretti TaxID=519541 RepID=A0AA35RKI6_GEOBA|nr:hypothetical protein GBAR_LOCUS7955 [Geodia barretti]